VNRLSILLACAVMVLASCVGPRARDNALLPAAQQAWPQVRVDFEAGLADGVTDGDLDPTGRDTLLGYADDLGEALTDGDRAALLDIPWDSQMRPWAVRGITAALDAGELGPNGSQLLYQRVANFTAAILVLQEKLVNAFSASIGS
jgi:hypothetical protein